MQTNRSLPTLMFVTTLSQNQIAIFFYILVSERTDTGPTTPLTQNSHYEEIADDHIHSLSNNNQANPSTSLFPGNNFEARIHFNRFSQSNSQNSDDYLIPKQSIVQVYNNLSPTKKTMLYKKTDVYKTM